MLKIRDIVKREDGDFYRFRIWDCGEGKFSLTMEEKPFVEKWGTSISITVEARRLQQLANEILNYLRRKVQWEEWTPTMEELAQRLEEIRPQWGVEMWFIDWVRFPGHKAEARKIYEWLKSNENWLYRKEEE